MSALPYLSDSLSKSCLSLGASISNTHTNAIGGSIKLAKSGSSAGADDVFVVKAAPLPVGSTVEVMSGNKVILQDADILQFQSDTAGSMDTIVSLLEIT